MKNRLTYTYGVLHGHIRGLLAARAIAHATGADAVYNAIQDALDVLGAEPTLATPVATTRKPKPSTRKENPVKS